MADVTEPVVGSLGLIMVASGASDGTVETDGSSTATYVGRASAAGSAETAFNTDVVRITEAIAMSGGATSMTATPTRVAIGEATGSVETDAYAAGGFVAIAETAGSAESDGTVALVRITQSPGATGSAETDATNPTPLPIYRLKLPRVEYSYTNNILLQRYPIHVGQSLMITGTSGEFVEIPTGTEIDEADFYFGGGRNHQLRQFEYDAVVNAGFGEYVEVA